MTYARNIAITLPLILIGALFLLLVSHKDGNEPPRVEPIPPTAISQKEGRTVVVESFVVRPFISDRDETGLSFLGGVYPIVDFRAPRLELGDPRDSRRLQVALLIDWTDSHCCMTYRLLRTLYDRADKEDLPGIDLYLLPVYRDASGKSVHEALMKVHFGSNRVDTLPLVVDALGNGTLNADDNDVHKFVENIDPDLASRWESLAMTLKDRYNVAFQLASAQQRHNRLALRDASIPQLMVFDSVMIGAPSPQTLGDYLRSAIVRQNEYLASPEGSIPVQIERGCKCDDPNHDHSGLGILMRNAPVDAYEDPSER